MKNSQYLLLFAVLIMSCSKESDDNPGGGTSNCSYSINVNDEFVLSGPTIYYNSWGGYINTASDETNCDNPEGALAMQVSPSVDWYEYTDGTVSLDTSDIDLFLFTFNYTYQWCEGWENQDDRWFSPKTEDADGNSISPFEWEGSDSTFEIETDNNGYGTMRVKGLVIHMTRDIINQGDEEEDITIHVSFTGMDLCN